jgi:S-ribosylhomocysteine lyase
MKKIASFTVNHDVLEKGMYISRIDGDVVTYDVRMKKPNGGDYFQMSAAHTLEHLFATYARNSKFGDKVVYVGPMGCRTGFYLLTRAELSHAQAIELVKESMAFAANFVGEIPGTTKIIIAQRVASVEKADKIIILDGGKIIACGTHDELLQTSDVYREIYEAQTKATSREGGES